MSKSLNGAKLSPKQTTQMLIGAGALILVVGGIIVFLMNSRINDMQAAVNNKETQVGSNEQVAQRYQQTLTAYNETLAHTQFLEASVSAKSFVPTLLKQLQDLATATHLTVDTVRPSAVAAPAPPTPKPADGDSSADDVKKAPPPPYDTLDIQVDVTGSYANSAAFLYGLTQFPKIVSVTSAQMQPDAATAQPGAPPLVKTSLHLTAFVFHDDKDAATTPGVTPAAPVSAAYAPHPFPVRAFTVGGTPNTVSDAAAHAAGSALGASKAAQARSEVGIETL